jgi:hypothetical protein
MNRVGIDPPILDWRCPTADRLVTYAAILIATIDLFIVSLFIGLPTLAMEADTKNTIDGVIVYLGVCLPVFSSLLAFMLLNPVDARTVEWRTLRFVSAAVLLSYSMFVCGYLVNIFSSGT